MVARPLLPPIILLLPILWPWIALCSPESTIRVEPCPAVIVVEEQVRCLEAQP